MVAVVVELLFVLLRSFGVDVFFVGGAVAEDFYPRFLAVLFVFLLFVFIMLVIFLLFFDVRCCSG